ncbi:ankyrin repeat domain-containing protein [Comamonadaceae bacterium G21597-S1]|nr:ankyrin repeat domain-containing protein [Comamonadaceae bacterium G21597-S1]
MNPGTPHGDDDDLIRLYHAAADRVGGAPSPAVGDAVRAHARVMAASRQPADPPDIPVVPDAGQDKASNAARWRVSMLASLALVALAGLLVLQFDRGRPQEQDLVRAPDAVVAQRGDAERSASLPAPQSAVESARDLPQARATATDAAPAPAPAPAPVAGPTRGAPNGADAVSAKALAPAPPAASTRADAAAAAGAPATAAPPLAEANRALRAVPSPEPLAGAVRPDVMADDAHGMAAAGNWPALASRLAAGMAVDVRDALGRTLLMRAAGAGQVDMVRRLLDAGADPRLVDTGGRTAGDWARRAERLDIASMLDDAQRNPGAGR